MEKSLRASLFAVRMESYYFQWHRTQEAPVITHPNEELLERMNIGSAPHA